MGKNTKNILLGAGIVALAYYLFSKNKNKVITPIATAPIDTTPIESLPVATVDPLLVASIEPLPAASIEPAPIVLVEEYLIESTTSESMPIFTNPIDEFINSAPLVIIEEAQEPTIDLSLQIKAQEDTDKILAILENIYDIIDNKYYDVSSLNIMLENINELEADMPYNSYLLEALGKVNLNENDLANSILEAKDYLAHTNKIKAEAQVVMNDLDIINSMMNISTKSSDNINTLNDKISKVELALQNPDLLEYLDNIGIDTNTSSDKIYVTNVLAEKNKVVEIANSAFIVGDNLDNICNHPYYTGLGDEQSGFVILYFEKENWDAITRNNPIGYKLYKDTDLTTPYTETNYITRWGTEDRILQLDKNGIIIDVLPACTTTKVKVANSAFIVGDDLDSICKHPYYTGLGDEQSGFVILYFREDNWGDITRDNPLGFKLYKDRNLTIPYTDTTYVTRWGTVERILELSENGTIVNVLPACQMKKIEVGAVDFIVNNDVNNLCQDPYFGGNGSASQVVRLYMDLADWSKLSYNTEGLKVYKDANLKTPWTETKYMVRWGNIDLPVFEINQNDGSVTKVLSPCYVINAENKEIHPVDQFILNQGV